VSINRVRTAVTRRWHRVDLSRTSFLTVLHLPDAARSVAADLFQIAVQAPIHLDQGRVHPRPRSWSCLSGYIMCETITTRSRSHEPEVRAQSDLVLIPRTAAYRRYHASPWITSKIIFKRRIICERAARTSTPIPSTRLDDGKPQAICLICVGKPKSL